MGYPRTTYESWCAKVIAIAGDLRAGVPKSIARKHGYNIMTFAGGAVKAVINDPLHVPTREEYEDYYAKQVRYTRKRDAVFSVEEVDVIPDEKIATANRKPKGMSEIRWRMEKARRKKAGYYSICVSPDMI